MLENASKHVGEERTAKARRKKAENERPHVKQEKRRDSIINNRETPDLFVDVETVTLDDKCCGMIRGESFSAGRHEPKTI